MAEHFVRARVVDHRDIIEYQDCNFFGGGADESAKAGMAELRMTQAVADSRTACKCVRKDMCVLQYS
jgi:hypothetical protein